jgi:hypothetical protein
LNCATLWQHAFAPTCAKPPPTIRYFYFSFFLAAKPQKSPLFFAAKRQWFVFSRLRNADKKKGANFQFRTKTFIIFLYST